MPNSANYRVTLELTTTGSLDAKLGDLTAKASSAHAGMQKLGESGMRMGDMVSSAAERMGGALERAADKAFELAKHMGEAGLAAGIAAAAYGVAHLNQQLESTQISLGAIFQAQGFAGSFEQGFGMASDQLAKMKQDVKSLPGDLGQLSEMMKMIATPAAQGGAGPDAIRKLAGRTMLTSTILGVQQEVAQREMAGLLSGRAGSHNIFGARLGLTGDEAEKFNKLGPAERLAKVNQELDRYQGAADRFGKSFTAQWTTLADNIKYSLLAPATSPLFEHVKVSLGWINEWFDSHKERIGHLVDTVGGKLAAAWDRVVGVVIKLEPLVEKIADRIESLKLSDVAHGLGAAGAVGMAAKFGGAALQSASPIARTLSSMMPEGIGGIEALTASMAPLVTMLPVLAGAFAFFAEVGVAVAGAIHAVTDETSHFHDRALALWQNVEHYLGDAFEHIGSMVEKLQPLIDAGGTYLLRVIESLAHGFDMAATAADHLMSTPFIKWLASKAGGYVEDPHPSAPFTILAPMDATQFMPEGWKQGSSSQQPKVQRLPDVRVGPITIQVQGNNDPSRVARLTVAELQKLARNPTSSKHVPNFTQASHG